MFERGFGDRSRFAFELNEYDPDNPRGRFVNIWAAGRHLTCEDDHAFAPQLSLSLAFEIDYLLQDVDRAPPFSGSSLTENHRRLWADLDHEGRRYCFYDWGPITDNVGMLLFRRDSATWLTFHFLGDAHPVAGERDRVFVVELATIELVRVLFRLHAELACQGWKHSP